MPAAWRMSVKRTGTEIGGILAVSALENSSATTPDTKANTSRTAGTSRLPLLPKREETCAICLLFVVNRDPQL
jgi:hypothetical protein